MTGKITQEMLIDRTMRIASDLRARGWPVMGTDAPDMFEMIGITFRVGTGQLVAFRLHYDLASEKQFERLFQVFEPVAAYGDKDG